MLILININHKHTIQQLYTGSVIVENENNKAISYHPLLYFKYEF